MGCGGSKEPEPTPPPAAAMARKRGSVAAQGGIDPRKLTVNLNSMPKIEKSPEAVEAIKAAVSTNVLMKALTPEYKDAVIAAMKQVDAKAGEYIIKQGERGDFWYVLEKGATEAYKKMPEDTSDGHGDKVKSYAPGSSFGELALMYNQRRAASVVAVDDCVLWAVDQEVFKQLMCALPPPSTSQRAARPSLALPAPRTDHRGCCARSRQALSVDDQQGVILSAPRLVCARVSDATDEL